MNVEFPEKFYPVTQGGYRNIVLYGGRGSSKSWSIARWLVVLALSKPIRVLCCREFQTSMKQSVYKLLCDQIRNLQLTKYYSINNNTITSVNGSEFFFSGIRTNPESIKSMEGIDIAWLEEAQTVSKVSLEMLSPTVRDDDSILIFTMNPTNEDDPVYERYILNTPPKTLAIEINFDDNPWFPEVLRDEMEYLKEVDYELYMHIWKGKCVSVSEAVVFNKKFECGPVNPKQNWNGPYYGVDFGFARDPSTMVRCWVFDNILYIEKEAYGKHIETRDLPKFFKDVDPHCDKYVMKADCSRPETISDLRQNGLPRMVACVKGSGSVPDGISYMRSFRKIIIDPSCAHTLEEFRLYKYKVDRLSGDILPVFASGNDHIMDAIRYALEPLITHKRQGQIKILN